MEKTFTAYDRHHAAYALRVDAHFAEQKAKEVFEDAFLAHYTKRHVEYPVSVSRVLVAASELLSLAFLRYTNACHLNATRRDDLERLCDELGGEYLA